MNDCVFLRGNKKVDVEISHFLLSKVKKYCKNSFSKVKFLSLRRYSNC